MHALEHGDLQCVRLAAPFYLLSEEGYAPTFRSLIEDTEWEKYGVGRNPRCDNCMAHCGFEGTAVNDAFSRPLKALKAALRGPRISGPMAPELPFNYVEGTGNAAAAAVPEIVAISIADIKRVSRESQDGPRVAAQR